MIRAMVKDGIIQPLEPMPPDWSDGHLVRVADCSEEPESDDVDRWLADMNALTAELNDEQEWQAIENRLAEADRVNKELMRREMGLP